jgi:TetR/AcrR family fatty acid metabolism transcriptional regulator
MPNSKKSINKKSAILDAAEDIISKKGLSESKISEIACKAGVTDSEIYQYYKGKEDLLFSIPGERMLEVMSILDDQLQAIRDSESQLSKMIWSNMIYNDTHPGYARILLLECRSSKAFYSTYAYQLIRKYAGILLKILEQGVENGTFRHNADMRLVRDIILGTLDMEVISCLATKEINKSVLDLDDFMSLILSMIKPKKERKRKNKKDLILKASEQIFAENGFSKSKIWEISKLAGVGEGTIYSYFKNKEDLFFSISKKHFEKYINELSELFETKSPPKKIERFIRSHFTLFLIERNFLKIFLTEIQLNNKFYESKAFTGYRNYYRVIDSIIEEGKEKGFFHSFVNPRIFRNMVLGAFSHLALRWFIVNKNNECDKMQEIGLVTELLMSSILEDEF